MPVINGMAIFSGLTIDKAGHPYYLSFSVQSPFEVNELTSSPFTVAPGVAVTVHVDTEPSGAHGGMPFTTQPIVSVRDAGGNVVTMDNNREPYSRLRVTLSNNPEDADVTTDNFETTIVEERLVGGFVNFTGKGLAVSALGVGYVMRFTATMQSIDGDPYVVHGDSLPFDVGLGDPAGLFVVRAISGAFDSGVPFTQGPILELRDAGGNVITTDDTTTVTATLLNPPTHFDLEGTTAIRVQMGVAYFLDLSRAAGGHGYIVQFATSEGAFATNTTFNVGSSSEFEIMALDREAGDMFGAAASVFGDTAFIGAPFEDSPILETQRVTSHGTEAVLRREIQHVRTSAIHVLEIQTMRTCGSGGGSLSGYFTLSWNGLGTTRPLAHNIHPNVLAAYIMSDIPDVGTISASNVRHYDCDVVDAYDWLLTFETLKGEIPEFTADINGDSGGTFTYGGVEYAALNASSNATNVTLTVGTHSQSPTLSGTFRLSVGGDRTPRGDAVAVNETGDIPFDAPAELLKQAIEDAVPLEGAEKDAFDVIVRVSEPDEQLGRTWSVTFPSSHSAYTWKELEVVGAGDTLLGYGSKGTVTTVQEGASPLRGSFQFWFRGFGSSVSVPWDASASDVENALESLPHINDVAVSHDGAFTAEGGTSWIVTFIETQSLDEYGNFQVDGVGNLPPLLAAIGNLTGSGARVEVQYAEGVDHVDTMQCAYSTSVEGPQCNLLSVDAYLEENERPQMGKFGHETGAVYVFERKAHHWTQSLKLVPEEVNSYDHFGHSVDVDVSVRQDLSTEGVAIVGAPHAEFRGVKEIQSIACLSDSGTFALLFRSARTSQLAFNIAKADLEAAIESLRTVDDVDVEYYDSNGDPIADASTGLCTTTPGGVVAEITFISPYDGDLPDFEWDVDGIHDTIEPTLVDSTAAEVHGYRPGSIVVAEVREGTTRAKITGDSGYTVGAAFIYRETAPGVWSKEARMFASDGVAGDTFGHDVAVYQETAVVTAPLKSRDGFNTSGAAYVFRADGAVGRAGEWLQSQVLVPPDPEENEQFGHAVAFHENTIVVSAMNFGGGAGRVLVWRREDNQPSFEFVHYQTIEASGSNAAYNFGCSVAVHSNTLVVGEQGATTSFDNAGNVHVYTRRTEHNNFYSQSLINPNNARHFQRFGHKVAVENDVLVAVAMEEFRGTRKSRLPVQSVVTTASDAIGGYFKLEWGIDATTPSLEHNISAEEMAYQLMKSLSTGIVVVSRKGPDTQGGYSWTVTFAEHAHKNILPLRVNSTELLTGTDAQVSVEIINEIMPNIRGAAHVFKRRGETWTEHAVMSPFFSQNGDLFGSALGISGQYAVVGAPNRDSVVSGMNAGSAIVYNLGFLNVKFEHSEYYAGEDEGSINITLKVCDGDGSCPIPNFGNFYLGFTTQDGTALGNHDCLLASVNTTECLWKPSDDDTGRTYGTYDFDAESDYAPTSGEVYVTTSEDDLQEQFVITNDMLHESPDEYFSVVIRMPGIEPVRNGELWTDVYIEDDGDGGVGVDGYVEMLHGTNSTNFGAASAIHERYAIVGSPFEDEMKGSAYVYHEVSGVWTLVSKITSPNPIEGGRFGISVDADEDRFIIGAPGEDPPTAYVLRLDESSNLIEGQLQVGGGRLPLPRVFKVLQE